jgi:hypothetical protein
VQNGNLVLLLLTLFISAITFTSGRTNILQGLVHGLLFLAYIVSDLRSVRTKLSSADSAASTLQHPTASFPSWRSH